MISADQIRNYPLFAKLSDAELESVAARLVKHSFAKGAYIYYPGNPGLNTYLVESGLVRTGLIRVDGQKVSILDRQGLEMLTEGLIPPGI